MRKPSCLISCSHWLPEGGLSVLVGRHGAMNPAGRARCNMRQQIKLGNGDYNAEQHLGLEKPFIVVRFSPRRAAGVCPLDRDIFYATRVMLTPPEQSPSCYR